MDKHLEENETKHLGLKLTAMEDLIIKQSELISKQRVKITELCKGFTMQNEKINKQNEKIKKQITEITTVHQKLEIQDIYSQLLFSIAD